MPKVNKNLKLGETQHVDSAEWQHTYKRRIGTDHPHIWVDRSVGYRHHSDGDMKLPAGFVPIHPIDSIIQPQQITVNEFVFTEFGEEELGYKIGFSVPFNSEAVASAYQAFRDVDGGRKAKLLEEVLYLYRLSDPYVIVTNLVEGVNPYKQDKRDVHISIGARSNNQITTLVTIDENGSTGNVSYGKAGAIHQNTRGRLDWSGDSPYRSELKGRNIEYPLSFEGWIGESTPLDGDNPDSSFMVFAGVRIHNEIGKSIQSYDKDEILKHIADRTLHKLEATIEPYIAVRRKDHPKL